MLFHTWKFALFFLIVYPIYLASKGTRFRLPWLLAASYVFYASFNPLYVVLILYSSFVDYTIVGRMEKSKHRKAWLSASIANNIGLLSFFKYGAFIADNINNLLSLMHIPYVIPTPGMLLPVGISFYVFQSLS